MMEIMRVLALGMLFLGMASGGALRDLPLHQLENNDLQITQQQRLPLENGINDEVTGKFFQDMVERNHELTAVESHVTQPDVSEPKVEAVAGSEVTTPEDPPPTKTSEVAVSTLSRPQTKKVIAILAPKPLSSSANKPHSRQKRFLYGTAKLRTIVVPLSIFNFLGFLPMRVPGLPYHNDPPLPDYSYYNTIHEIPKKRIRYFASDY